MTGLNELLDRYRGQRNPLRSERLVELACLVAGALLLLQLLLLLWRAVVPPTPEVIPPAEGLLKVGALQEPAKVGRRDSAELVARPLFWEERRPLAETPAEPEKAKKQPPKRLKGLSLQGVFGAADTRGVIVLREGKRHRLLLGDTLGDWRLDSVEAEQAVFVSEGESQVVKLKRVETGISFSEAPTQQNKSSAATDGGGTPNRPAPDASEGGLTLGGRR